LESFEAVLAGCREGNDAAARTLITEFYTYVHRIAKRKIKNEEHAQDLAAEFFVLLLEKKLVQKFRGNSIVSFKAYLTACFVNHLKQWYRENANEVEHEVPSELLELELVATTIPPDIAFEREEDSRTIRDMIDEMPFKFKAIMDLQLRYFTQSEIAQLLHLPLGTVAKYSQRAKQTLRKLLDSKGFTLGLIASIGTALFSSTS